MTVLDVICHLLHDAAVSADSPFWWHVTGSCTLSWRFIVQLVAQLLKQEQKDVGSWYSRTSTRGFFVSVHISPLFHMYCSYNFCITELTKWRRFCRTAWNKMISHCILLSSYHTLSKNVLNAILSSNTLHSLCYGIYSLFPTVTMKEKRWELIKLV
jgi:hypothetical protein